MSRKMILSLLLILFSFLAFIHHAMAGEESKGSNLEFNLAPFYLWAVSIDGDVAIGSQGDSVALDFGQIFDNLEGIFIVHFETLYKKKYGLLFDINYLDIGSSTSLPQTDVDVNLKATIAELAPYYRLNNGDHNFDFLAGLLYSKVETDVVLSAINRDINVTEDWVDPYLGIRWLWSFAENWSTSVKGAIGGFGVASDFVWEGSALLTWQPWKHASIIAGYRVVSIDYESGSGPTKFVYDVNISGPMFGINFIF